VFNPLLDPMIRGVEVFLEEMMLSVDFALTAAVEDDASPKFAFDFSVQLVSDYRSVICCSK